MGIEATTSRSLPLQYDPLSITRRTEFELKQLLLTGLVPSDLLRVYPGGFRQGLGHPKLCPAQADSFTQVHDPFDTSGERPGTAITQTWHGRFSTDHRPGTRTQLEDSASNGERSNSASAAPMSREIPNVS